MILRVRLLSRLHMVDLSNDVIYADDRFLNPLDRCGSRFHQPACRQERYPAPKRIKIQHTLPATPSQLLVEEAWRNSNAYQQKQNRYSFSQLKIAIVRGKEIDKIPRREGTHYRMRSHPEDPLFLDKRNVSPIRLKKLAVRREGYSLDLVRMAFKLAVPYSAVARCRGDQLAVHVLRKEPVVASQPYSVVKTTALTNLE
ncbi:uncharacterized protein BDR25DRAFT_353664 [Lindgomyces ingoldianus]|uniref:Uncharacterized protein n=1 Tax=Lindgomyces ingoldianus TaxID=673940 RepID=A0ACB6R011_9PLEO|nr:uncharacterized protein BDR25DRAFT_353664 [Lindgomyces ingoldianus]KAF2472629.1 hypothetical protein BDR25DRAFT_353664 [Lindgomyces ingoldianus]